MKTVYIIFGLLTAMVGYAIHQSIGWAIVDFLFPCFAWIKWIICHEVTMTIIQNTFSWFFV